jgi:DNA-binding transcriptional regulator YiaG
MRKNYQSELLMILHQDAESLHRIGVLSDTEMREFDEDCLLREAQSPATPRRQPAPPAYAGEHK